MNSLKNQVAVVTGASSGIGKACSFALAKEGVIVCLLGRKSDELQKIEDELRKMGFIAKAFKVDLVNDIEIDRTIQLIQKEFGKVSILIHSAGVFSMGRIEKAPVQELDYQYQINVRAPYLLTQKMLTMLISNQGQIVFMNSTVAMGAKSQLSQYCATKFALKALADSLRLEVNSQGVRVFTLYPGRTASPTQEKYCKLDGILYEPDLMIQPEQIANLLVVTLNMPRNVEITDTTIRPMHNIK